jgi:hypothetical protein
MLSSLSPADLKDLSDRQLTPADLDDQLKRLTSEPFRITMDRPCTVGDGILSIVDPSEVLEKYSDAITAGRVMRFVPSSGAASRMLDVFRKVIDEPRSGAPWMKAIERFAFFSEWSRAAKDTGLDIDQFLQSANYAPLIRVLLSDPGLNFDSLPKALIPFHRYPGEVRTAFDEQLAETVMLLGPKSTVHFTIADRHRDLFQTAAQKARKSHPELTIEFSVQHPSTDTICLDAEGRVLRDTGGRMVFRPGGHGALLKNLQDCGGDIVVIKNIDNVMPEHRLAAWIGHRQILIGLLIDTQEKVFDLLRSADQNAVDRDKLSSVLDRFDMTMPSDFDRLSVQRQAAWIRETYDRPMRVCAVVPDSGHPGGGPFWVPAEKTVTRQIVELEQLERSNQTEIKTTHFNPVDMVCGLKNYQGQPFPLTAFRDERQYLVVQKTYQGKPIRTLEWPGLWNGGMAGWLTLFVEVPRETFTPVKMITDLLKPEHQA